VVSVDKLAVDDVSGLQDNRSSRIGVVLTLVGSHLAARAGHGGVKKRARTMAATTTAAHNLEKVATLRETGLAEGLDLLEGLRRKTVADDGSDGVRELLRALYADGGDSRSDTSDDGIHTRLSAADIRIRGIIRKVGTEGGVTSTEDGVEVLEGKDVVDLLLAKTLSELGDARTNEDGLAARITLLADLTDVVHGRAGVADGRLDLGDVLVDHVDPSRAAGGGHEGESTLLLLLEVLHALIKLSSLGGSGDISTNSDLDADIETGLHASLLEGSDGDGVREVTSNGRSEHGNHLAVGIDHATDDISDLSARLDSTEGAVLHALTAADALVPVENLAVIRKSLDGTDRAVRDARSGLVDDSTEGAGLGAVAATDTLCRVDASLASGVIDSLLGAGLSARTSSAVLAHVSHDVLLLGATVAVVVHESEDRESKIRSLALHGLLGELSKRLTVIFLTLQAKSSNDAAANLATFSSIFLRDEFLRKILDLLDELALEDQAADTLHDVVLHLDDTVGDGRSREVHFALRRSRNTRMSRSSSHYHTI